MMKRTGDDLRLTIMRVALSIALFLSALAAAADEIPPRPDYSREAMLHMFAQQPDEPLPPGRVHWHAGAVEFRALGMNWRILALPFLAPLPGGRLGDGATIPNAFALTGTPYASTMPPMFDSDRSWGVQRERARIERMVRKQSRVSSFLHRLIGEE